MRPLLICELGLHGDGILGYHTAIVDQIVKEWSGWPPIAIKVQAWTPGLPWASAIKAEHGRLPLACLDQGDLVTLSSYCRDRTLLFGCTAHDTIAAAFLMGMGSLGFIKLGARVDVHTKETVRTRESTVPVISSAPGTPWATRNMQTVSAYPANAPWSGNVHVPGYSCHSVPGLAQEHVLKAAPHCHTIEVHVTARPKNVRPLPADMSVSLSIGEFLELSKQVGRIWKA